jgi:phosphoribosylanthranilate isomerase
MVKEIISSGKGTEHLKVGVFVNEEQQRVADIFHQTGLNVVQLHGDESPEYCHELGLPFWKVIRVKDHLSLRQLHQMPGDTILLDTFSKTERGGTGRPFSLHLARTAINSGKKIIIAGGVSTANIREILALSPFAVDVSSSLEISPGKKCPLKMSDFFKKIRSRG